MGGSQTGELLVGMLAKLPRPYGRGLERDGLNFVRATRGPWWSEAALLPSATPTAGVYFP
jgi:hypothetical protein